MIRGASEAPKEKIPPARPEDDGHRPEGGDGEPGEDQDREKRTDVSKRS